MFSATPELYDLIYKRFKDYAGEARRLAALLARHHPGATSLLDVGCGTGEHALLLRTSHGYDVDGVDLDPELIRIARRKNPDSRFEVADMVDFRLDGRYDAVLCLFSSIAYVKTLGNVRRALEAFCSHLEPDGVVVVEPWFAPEQWQPGSVYLKTAVADGVEVCRMSHSALAGRRLSVLDFHYLIGGVDGIQHRREVHELGLFTTTELERCFRDAGLAVVEHDPVGLTGRGLLVARAA